jgi:anaerobic ribonucleoside-triphosphate reductase activating protein
LFFSQVKAEKMMVQQSNDNGCRLRSGLNLAGFLARSTVNGPGTRSVVWVQGCPLHCRDCFNTASWSFSPNRQVSPGQLADRVLGIDGIDGVTFSGGEPFAQAGLLALLGKRLQAEGLTVITYTGFPAYHIFRKQRPSWNALLAVTDLLIAGPYVASLPSVSPFAGSGNQQVISLTGAIPARAGTSQASAMMVEYTISSDGSLTTTGFPDQQCVQQLAARCRGD